MSLQEKIAELRKLALERLADIADEKTLNELRVSVLGKKGQLTDILKGMKDLTNEERPKIGALANELRDEITSLLEDKKAVIEAAIIAQKLANETLDVTLPGTKVAKGNRHILTQTTEEIEGIFLGMGYQIVDGY